jgi:hypothetical protein
MSHEQEIDQFVVDHLQELMIPTILASRIQAIETYLGQSFKDYQLTVVPDESKELPCQNT